MPMQQIILIRGLPGSGKSTIARRFAEMGYKHFEADQYFMVDGIYTWDAAKIADAHAWCLQATKDAMLAGHNVVVSNTFVRRWEVQPYLKLALEASAIMAIMVATGKYKNIHNVPEATIQRMKESWEPL